jgi:SAM-dependent methyltransferase
MSANLDEDYWQNRYLSNQAGWDLGSASDPIIQYVNQLINKDISILIPGCGNAYEAEYLIKNGFHDVTVIDLAEAPLANLKNRVPEFPASKLLKGDFFELNKQFDLICHNYIIFIFLFFFPKKYLILQSNY